MKKKTEIIILTIMCFILSIAISMQIKTVNNNGSTIGSSQSESNLKAQVLQMKEKYENEYNKLEELTEELEKVRQDVSSNSEELKGLEDKIKKDNILLGNTDVKGQGVSITLNDGKSDLNLFNPENLLVHAENVLLVVNELKNAGAEAISVNGQRIVNSSDIVGINNNQYILVNGERIVGPYEVKAIGNKEEFDKILNFKDSGFIPYYRNKGYSIEMHYADNISINAYNKEITLKYLKDKKEE